MIRKLCLALVALLLLAPPSANAYWPYMGYGGYGGWGGWGYGAATQYRPAPPYFALYPPVYYSHQITARHYGASPFAWSAGMQPITYAHRYQPAMILNPNAPVNKAVSQPVASASMEPAPLEIANPFLVSLSR